MHPQERKRMAATKLDFKKNYNYQWCYVVGKFRLYIYDNEYHQKIDANQYQLMCGEIKCHEPIFAGFLANFPAGSFGPEVAEEVKRVGMKIDEAYKKVCGTPGWFRITFNEIKYEPGTKPVNP